MAEETEGFRFVGTVLVPQAGVARDRQQASSVCGGLRSLPPRLFASRLGLGCP
jgi:hypothetical protein